jgi:hypothetical protein
MQTQKAVERIHEQLSGISDLYNPLLLVVGSSGSGKTALLRSLAAQTQYPMLNLGAELSRRLLDLTERQRVLQLPRLLDETLTSTGAGAVIFDNTEILFDPMLRQDPLRLLHGLSRNKTIIASWLGAVETGHLTYATPEHPEFRRYPVDDLLFVAVGQEGDSASEGKEKK